MNQHSVPSICDTSAHVADEPQGHTLAHAQNAPCTLFHCICLL